MNPNPYTGEFSTPLTSLSDPGRGFIPKGGEWFAPPAKDPPAKDPPPAMITIIISELVE